MLMSARTSDRFGALPRVTGLVFDVEGQFAVIQPDPKKGGPSILVGGEVRVPADTQAHAKEYAVYGGPAFQIRNWTIGVDAQVRRIVLPPATLDNQFFVRDKMDLFELPIVIKYTFGSGKRAFVQASGAPEFSPRFRYGGSLVSLPNPNFDHAYFIRGSAGYSFGKWYAKATYQTRYFKFTQNNTGNPLGLYNWRNDVITGGVGYTF